MDDDDNDPLAQFTRGDDGRARPKVEHDERHYTAYQPATRAPSLCISRANGIDDYQSYGTLLKVKGSRLKQTSFRIFYTFESVRVTGHNLLPVMEAVAAKRCDYILEFDPRLHNDPGADKPKITRIEFINQPLSASLAEIDEL